MSEEIVESKGSFMEAIKKSKTREYLEKVAPEESKSNCNNSDDDEFFDAQDYFDQDILKLLRLDRDGHVLEEAKI